MKNKQRAAATAILGLAFGGMAGGADADPGIDTAGFALAAVDNLAAGLSSGTLGSAQPLAQAGEDGGGTVSASGAPIGAAAVTTGNRNTGQVAQSVLTACAGGSNAGTQFQADCNALVGGAATDPSGAANALTALTADQILAQNNAMSHQVSVISGAIENRLLGLLSATRQDGSAMSQALADGLLYGRGGGAASADEPGGSTGFFFSAKYLDGSQDRDAYTRGYDLDGWNLTAGADYRLGPNLIAGVMGNYNQGSVDYKDNKGRMTMDGWGLGAYGTYYLDSGLFFEGLAGYNWSHYDLNRRIDYSLQDPNGVATVTQHAKSSPDGGVFYATFGSGYNISRQSFTFTPQLSLNYVRNNIGSYREHMSDPNAPGGGWALNYDSQRYTSFTSRLGVLIANAFSTSAGVLVPQVGIDWIHEFENDQQGTSARFINDISATPMTIWTSKPDHNYFDLGIGLSGQFANGRSAFVSLNSILGYEDVNQYAITAGFRLEF